MTKILPIDLHFGEKATATASPGVLFSTRPKSAVPMFMVGPFAVLVGLVIGWFVA